MLALFCIIYASYVFDPPAILPVFSKEFSFTQCINWIRNAPSEEISLHYTGLWFGTQLHRNWLDWETYYQKMLRFASFQPENSDTPHVVDCFMNLALEKTNNKPGPDMWITLPFLAHLIPEAQIVQLDQLSHDAFSWRKTYDTVRKLHAGKTFEDFNSIVTAMDGFALSKRYVHFLWQFFSSTKQYFYANAIYSKIASTPEYQMTNPPMPNLVWHEILYAPPQMPPMENQKNEPPYSPSKSSLSEDTIGSPNKDYSSDSELPTKEEIEPSAMNQTNTSSLSEDTIGSPNKDYFSDPETPTKEEGPYYRRRTLSAPIHFDFADLNFDKGRLGS